MQITINGADDFSNLMLDITVESPDDPIMTVTTTLCGFQLEAAPLGSVTSYARNWRNVGTRIPNGTYTASVDVVTVGGKTYGAVRKWQ